MGVLNLYHDWFPERYDEALADISQRFVDTHQIAMDAYYHPDMQCSFSLKNLAPALLGRGYEDLTIQDGMLAVRQWRSLISGELDEEESAKIRSGLLEYCGRDTQLLFDVLEEFQRLARRPR